MHLRPFPLLLVALGLATSCTRQPPGEPAPAGSSRDVLTGVEIRERGFTNAHQAVAAMRANWLRVRGMDSAGRPAQVLVYMDDMRLGGVESLRSIPTAGIVYIRYYDGNEATARWGLDHGQGVVLVSTRP